MPALFFLGGGDGSVGGWAVCMYAGWLVGGKLGMEKKEERMMPHGSLMRFTCLIGRKITDCSAVFLRFFFFFFWLRLHVCAAYEWSGRGWSYIHLYKYDDFPRRNTRNCLVYSPFYECYWR